LAYPTWASFAWECLDNAIAFSTKKAYSSGWKKWAEFCSLCNILTSSQSQEHFFLFIGYLRSLPSINAYSTYKKYFSAIRAVHLAAGLPEPFDRKPTLARGLLGLKKTIGTHVNKKRPLTIHCLKLLISAFDFDDPDDFIIFAILVIAVFGLFRLGELTTTPGNQGSVPIVDHVSAPDNDVRYIRLLRSKTDPFANSADVPVGRTDHPILDPVVLLDSITKNKKPHEPLFTLPSTGKPVSRATVVKRLKTAITKLGWDESEFSGHSARAGGAQSLEDLGYSPDEIKEIGRWKSYCWMEYRNMPIYKFKQISSRLAFHFDLPRLNSRVRSHN
jgi:hypothetical protein